MNVVPLKRKIPADPICETPTYRRVTQLLEMCHTRGAMGRIIGPPGVGKTVAIKAFARANEGYHNNNMYPSIAVRHEVSVENGESMLKFLKSLGDTVGVYCGYGTASMARDRISEALRQAPEATIIVDEAQKLNAKNVELLREFHDDIRCGLILCGNSDIATRYGNLRGAAFAQIESRISYRLTLERSSEEDIRAVCKHEHIGNARAIAKLVKLGQGPLGLRIVADVIAQTRLIVGERAIAPADIDKTLAFMGVQI